MPRKRDTRQHAPHDPHSAEPSGARAAPADGPPRPPRPAIGLPVLSDGRFALPEGNPCEGCDHCCRYVALPIRTPRTNRDFEEIRWYVLHENVSVYIDWEGDWGIQFQAKCSWLRDGRCTHYELRPHVCREYDPAECERYVPEPAEKILIRNTHDLERYLAEREERLRKRAARRAGAARASRNGAARP